MRKDDIVRFLVALGVDYPEIVIGDEWVNSPCPMAPWTHAAGTDTRPSFGIRINDEGISHYYCFGCSPEGKILIRLLHNTHIMRGRYPKRAAEIYVAAEIHDEDAEKITAKAKDTWEDRNKKPLQIPPLPYEVLNQYPLLQFSEGKQKEACLRFLEEERLIPYYYAYLYGVRYDWEDQALIFPLKDRKGYTYLLRSRLWNEKSIWTISPKVAGFPNLVFPRLKEIGAWFGMELVDWRKTVIAVEAELDVLRAVSLGQTNVIASATSSVSEAQIKTLLMGRRVILGYDADRAGSHTHKRIIDRAAGKSDIYVVDWSIGEKHELFRKNKDDVYCKDAGDLKDSAELQKVLRNVKKA